MEKTEVLYIEDIMKVSSRPRRVEVPLNATFMSSVNGYIKHRNLCLNWKKLHRKDMWTEDQEREFILTILKNRETNREIYINCVNFQDKNSPYILIDGYQRMNALIKFMNGELLIKGRKYSELASKNNWKEQFVIFNIVEYKSEKECLNLYLNLNVFKMRSQEEVKAVIEELSKLSKGKSTPGVLPKKDHGVKTGKVEITPPPKVDKPKVITPVPMIKKNTGVTDDEIENLTAKELVEKYRNTEYLLGHAPLRNAFTNYQLFKPDVDRRVRGLMVSNGKADKEFKISVLQEDSNGKIIRSSEFKIKGKKFIDINQTLKKSWAYLIRLETDKIKDINVALI
jgi:hypothetical protein